MSESNNPIHGQLVPSVDAGRTLLLAPRLKPVDGFDGYVRCSFTPVTQEEKTALFVALDGGGESFEDNIERVIELIHVAQQIREQTNPIDNLVELKVVTTLFCKSGKVYSGTSEYVARSIKSMIASGLVPPFEPPYRVKLVSIKATQGSLIKLRPVGSVEIDGEELGDAIPGKPGKSKR